MLKRKHEKTVALALALLLPACLSVPDGPPPPPVIDSFTVTPSTVTYGQPATLAWAVRGERTTLLIDRGVGVVTGSSKSITPCQTGAYRLKAFNAGGVATALVTVTVTGPFLTPATVPGDVVVSVDSHCTIPISPLLYGLNNVEFGGDNTDLFRIWSSKMPGSTSSRVGGARSTTLNWENGYSNCGADCGFSDSTALVPPFRNDTNLLDNVFAKPGLGSAWAPRIEQQMKADKTIIVTAPILGYVAKDDSGKQDIPVQASHTAPGVPSAAHWNEALPHDPTGATATPNTSDGFVYTDDFVKWIDTRWPGKLAAGRVQIELDNEPDLWRSAHAEVLGTATGTYTQQVSQDSSKLVSLPFDWYSARSIEHALAVKAVAPDATLWAGGFAFFDALVQFSGYAHPEGPPAGYDWYFSSLLDDWKAAEVKAGRRLIDVFDFHWYVQPLDSGTFSVGNDDLPQTDAGIEARLQSTRSLWDPWYVEKSWVNLFVPPAFQQNCSGEGSGGCPIALIPRMQESIALHAPGTKLAIGEYWYGRGGDISGALATVDFLGILARYGVYAANLAWGSSNVYVYFTPNQCTTGGCASDHAYQCALKAIDLYRDVDGTGTPWGDTYVPTSVSDAGFTLPASQKERVTAYSATLAGDPTRMVVVAINKTLRSALNAGFMVTHTSRFSAASVYQTTGTNGGAGGCPTSRPADITLSGLNAFNATLPAQSVTVFILRP